MTIIQQIDQFIFDKCITNKQSQHTNRYAMHKFAKFLVSIGHKGELDTAVAVRYSKHLEETVSPATRRLAIGILKQFSRWRADNRMLPFAERLKPPRMYDGFKRKPLTREQLTKLVASLNTDTIINARNRAAITLMLTHALRSIEVSRMDVADVFDDDGVITLRIQGKGHTEKDYITPISSVALDAINDYLVLRGDVTDESPMFINHNHRQSEPQRWSRSEVSRTVTELIQRLGFVKRYYTAHSLRHTVATHLIRSGWSIYDVKIFMRHKSIKTTELYVRFGDEERIRISKPEQFFSTLFPKHTDTTHSCELT